MFKRYNRIKKFLLLGVVVISTFYLASCNKSNEDSSYNINDLDISYLQKNKVGLSLSQ